MGSHTFLYLTTDGTQKVNVAIAKDIQLAKFLVDEILSTPEAAAARRNRILHVERFPTMLEANDRLNKLKKMSHHRRMSLIRRMNPNLLEVDEFSLPDLGKLGDWLDQVQSSLGWLMDVGTKKVIWEDKDDDGLGGVGARIPNDTPAPPRTDAVSQPRPPEESQG
jgi:hypothetical protein